MIERLDTKKLVHFGAERHKPVTFSLMFSVIWLIE